MENIIDLSVVYRNKSCVCWEGHYQVENKVQAVKRFVYMNINIGTIIVH